jgi:hypothetical protein
MTEMGVSGYASREFLPVCIFPREGELFIDFIDWPVTC